MSHSNIYQISSKRIAKDDYASSSDFWDNSSDFADYIGDEIEDEDDRKEDIKYLANTLSDLFDLSTDGKALVYKGEEAMQEFKQKWADAIQQVAQEVTADSVTKTILRWSLRTICEETHLRSACRVSIEEWNGGCPGPMDDMVEWLASSNFKAGRKIYIGAIIDYHY